MIVHNPLSGQTIIKRKEDPYKVTYELLDDGQTELTCFYFHFGANFYVFSYQKGGIKRHTLIDTGDPSYQDRIISILTRNHIDPAHIERIIITHRHYDHCGLADVLAGRSGAKILVHANFRNFIEGPIGEEDRLWLRGFEPARLRSCRVEYFSPSGQNPSVSIDGLIFHGLTGPLPVGGTGRLEILACPESPTMHSPDQIIVRYRPQSSGDGAKSIREEIRPAGHLLFPGDLWLMHGPLFSKSFRYFSLRIRMASKQMKGVLSGKKQPRRDPRQQDIQAKEALKRGFTLIRVMPGHGEDFIGTRMIPFCFLCDRDLLVELGFALNEKKTVLHSESLAQKIETLREKAYASVIKELFLWKKLGYDEKEISELLVRIYLEQKGGGPLVQEDRHERRQRIVETLVRLRDETAGLKALKELAESTLEKIKSLS
jgi:glyoxylase-like metal-dependent hydrolase (beta-lactamase superfamily II)